MKHEWTNSAGDKMTCTDKMLQCETTGGKFWALPANEDVTAEILRLSSALTASESRVKELEEALAPFTDDDEICECGDCVDAFPDPEGGFYGTAGKCIYCTARATQEAK